ncbi:amino acid ABC transporter permease [Aidingimonas halophila]|uniref:Polar amino acid transport system permease protein n=1 Tax=Aidingimonas halophila TaxID=574349 RepID=A0A1H3EF77_9GAMM|nr:amino acid ABC transporter permease [Aidingimonas halophila]GHC33498.1 amino acid ABC transporter [Aidingimonas halophila]SDX77275.1 polar amino acid transport system permease protein [Aidingimonas halophila]
MFDFQLLFEMRGLILQGLWNTVWICFLGCLVALGLGLVLASLRLSSPRLVGPLVATYIELCRGIPLLVILFLLYYGGPSIGLRLSAEIAGLVGIGLYGAGYFAEIYRGGFLSIPQGQLEAARMLGISRLNILRRIQIPQMLQLIVPPSTNQLIILVKESALLSVISVDDLTKNATAMVNETFAVIEPYITVALLYWLIIETIARGGYALEKRLAQRSRMPTPSSSDTAGATHATS